MKKFTKIVALLLAVCAVLSFAACSKNEAPELAPEINEEEYMDASAKIYDAQLKEFADALAAAKAETTNISKRYVLMAIAEAKLLESAVYLPSSCKGGNYAIGRVAPYSITPVLWGNDSYRYHNALICTDLIKAADRDEMKAKYAELKGTGTYEDWAKSFLTSKGYTIKDTYTVGFSSDPKTWDILGTYRAADSEAIVNTFDGLFEYDGENNLQPALATGYTVSGDGLTYTFTLRQGVKWVDAQGTELGELTAGDFVAGLQHLLDAAAGLEYLVDGIIKNAGAYLAGEVTDFAQVGVKATDNYTLVYTLEQPVSYFMTMLGYNPFAPLCKTYYESKGGKFGADFKADDENYTYGTSYDTIAYCGPYIVTNFTSENKIVFSANEKYWNKDKINVKTLTWLFNDGKDATKAYNDMKAGVLDGCGLNASALELAKKDGLFDDYHYVSGTDATSYGTFYNLNRTYYANFNDTTKTVTGQTVASAEKAQAAMKNVHFRRALSFALDRGAYNAQTVGEELKLVSVINSYTPGNFVQLTEDVTIAINGKDTTFAAGTYYGAVMQAQIDADGVKFKVWDPNGDSGLGSSAGFDGWYNVDNAVEELNKAIEELAKDGVKIDEKHPVTLEMPCFSGSPVYANRATACKKSIEDAFGGKVILNLTDCPSSAEWYYAGYYCDYGYQCNYDLYDCSGWGPDYGDPATYLNTLYGASGDMIHCLGIY